MNQNICNICGANYEYRNGRWKCPACGAFKAEELSNEEVTLFYNAAQKLRLCDFDEAEKAYTDIIEKFPKNPNGYWERLLSRYGIKYEEDFDGRKIPTCYAASIESVLNDKDYIKALALADADTKAYFEQQAQYIERVRKEWIERARKEKPYDIFICYKESDLANGIERTQDSIAAQDLYIHLTEQGYRVFFSRESLRDKVGEKYEPYIFNALSTAKVMLVYGTSSEYITSTWLKNEWTRYEKRLQAGEKRANSLIVACDGFSPAELPKVLSSMQCFDATKRSFYTDLDAIVRKIIKGDEKPKPVAEPKPEKKKSKVLPIAIAGVSVVIAILLCILLPNLFGDKPTATIIDSKYGVVITAQDEIFDENTSVIVDRQSEGTQYTSLLSAVNNEKSIELQNAIVYDIECDADITKNVTVKVAYAKSSASAIIKVYYVSDDKTVIEEHSCIYDEGFVEFKTSHLSYYVIGEIVDPFSNSSNNNDDNSNNSETNDTDENNTDENNNDDNNTDEETPSENLELEEHSDGYYIVKGIGNCQDEHIVIPSVYKDLPVKAIDARAFYDCGSITAITIPESIETIGEYAFALCSNLKSVYISNIVAWCKIEFANSGANPLNCIGDLYLDNTLVTNLMIPKDAEIVGDFAFSNCKSITNVTVQEGITSIGEKAFYWCSGLKRITIPESIVFIGKDVFENCNNLNYNEYSNSYYLGNNSNPYVALMEAKNTDIDSNVIHNDAKVIAPNSFFYCQKLTSIEIPNNVVYIGDLAFGYCSKLETVSLGNKLTHIGMSGFGNCTSLTTISIPKSVTFIGNFAFRYCDNLTSINYEGTQIDWASVEKGYECTGSATIIFQTSESENPTEPSDEVVISFDSNGGTGNVAAITVTRDSYIDMPTNSFVREGYTFLGWSSTSEGEEWEYAEGVVCKASASKIYYAKWSKNDITVIVNFHPNGAEGNTIQIEAQSNTSITFPKCDFAREGYSFDAWGMNVTGTSSLYSPNDEYKIESSVEELNFYAIWLPNENTVVLDANGGFYAEYDNGHYVNYIESETVNALVGSTIHLPLNRFIKEGYSFIGWSTTSDGIVAYADESEYTMGTSASVTIYAVWMPNTSTQYVVNHYQENLDNASYTLEDTETLSGTTDSSVTPATKDYTGFCAPTTQTIFVLADGSAVVNYYYARTEYTVTYVTNGGNQIGMQTYKYEQTASLSDAIRSGYSFGGWFSDEALTNQVNQLSMNENKTVYAWWSEENKPSDFDYSKSGTRVVVYEYVGSDEVMVIPSYIGGSPVTTIAASAFKGNTVITSATLPEQLGAISDNLFEDCTSLTEIKSFNAVSSIGQYAFSGCTSLKRFNSTKDYELIINDGVETIGTYAFKNVSLVQKIVVPNSVTRINEAAFNGCDGLKDLTIPFVGRERNDTTYYNNLGFIFSEEYRYSEPEGSTRQDTYDSYHFPFMIPLGIERITVTDTTFIGRGAFQNLNFVKSITIDCAVEQIDCNAFSGLTTSTTIIYSGTMEEWQAIEKYDAPLANWGGNYLNFSCDDGTVTGG